jgi:DNA-binding IclR family transcriptional regulator
MKKPAPTQSALRPSAPPPEAGDARGRRGIQSIEVGGQLLRALAAQASPMMLRDLALAAGMPAAKAHPYLVSFGKLGMITQDTATNRYRLGPLALQMGLASLAQLDPVREALPAIAALAGAIDQTVALAVWGNQGPTIVRIEQSGHPLHVNMRTGTVMSLLQTATGRVFAAFLPSKLTGPMIDAEWRALPAMAGRRMTRRDVEEELATVRRHRLAQAVGQPIPGINALSAPVFDHGGGIELVITAMGPSGTFDARLDGPIAQALTACARELSARLGNAGP